MATVQDLVPGVVKHLVNRARLRTTTTYLEVAADVGTHPRVIPRVLEVLRALCLQKGWPPLTVLVYSTGKSQPGEAFLDPWLPRNAPAAAREAAIQAFLQQVYDFDWSPLVTRYLPKSG